MKDLKKNFQNYNKPDSLLVISSYPEKGIRYSRKVCAVGGFAKNTIDSLKKEFKSRGENKKVIILTVTTNGKREIYEEDDNLVIRCFVRNNPKSYFELIKYFSKFNQVKDILVEFEFASFGNTLTTGLFPLVLWLAKILRKNTSLVLHQVIFDLNQLSGHLGFQKSRLKSNFFQGLLRIFYWLLCLPVQNVVVLEQEFKDRLKLIVPSKKILVIPHGVDAYLKPVSKSTARKKLGLDNKEKVILYFGYLTWYKGVDWLVKNFDIKNAKLIIAGGPSFTQKDKLHYQRFIHKVYQQASKKANITITGFIAEKSIPLYFSAADLVILPYRVFMSSSGPMSTAISFTKPFLLSNSLRNFLKTEDFRKGKHKFGLKDNDLIFNLTKKSLTNKIEKADLAKLTSFSSFLREKRGFENLSFSYYQLLTKEKSLSWKKRFLPNLRFQPRI